MMECWASCARLIGFSDNLPVVVVTKHREYVELYGSKTIHVIKAWLQMIKLNLTDGGGPYYH